ncbi:MAG: BatA domain-containing protein, partial [Planctomycetota bacterium]
MTFATPALAAIAATVAIPALLILYFLKLRRRDVEVSSTLLWKQTIEDMQANAPFQRLRKNLLLFLQLLALIAGLFALAQPELDSTAVTGSRHTIII